MQTVADLRGELAGAKTAAAVVARDLADFKLLAEWLEQDGRNKRPTLRILSRKITSTSVATRLIVVRLLPIMGSSAKILLRKAAKNDKSAEVRAAAEAALGQLGD